ncbi:L,D-transpeptidase [Nitrosomonadales bacterium]|nr:L,D-transpeptidase [Nitrosomonadales bacterium]
MKLSINISIKEQSLLVYLDSKLIKSYLISTALKGVGQEKNSFKTPLGTHYIRAMIGEGVPSSGVFEGRRYTGVIWSNEVSKLNLDHDWILSRILWLSGMEVGINRLGNHDTMQRYIYIHGTPYEEKLGKPCSNGCIRMANKDVIELFELVLVGTIVNINEK